MPSPGGEAVMSWAPTTSQPRANHEFPRIPASLGLLGRALGHFIFSLIGLKRILFTNIFQKL